MGSNLWGTYRGRDLEQHRTHPARSNSHSWKTVVVVGFATVASETVVAGTKVAAAPAAVAVPVVALALEAVVVDISFAVPLVAKVVAVVAIEAVVAGTEVVVASFFVATVNNLLDSSCPAVQGQTGYLASIDNQHLATHCNLQDQYLK